MRSVKSEQMSLYSTEKPFSWGTCSCSDFYFYFSLLYCSTKTFPSA